MRAARPSHIPKRYLNKRRTASHKLKIESYSRSREDVGRAQPPLPESKVEVSVRPSRHMAQCDFKRATQLWTFCFLRY
jgi:hypothetical protein